MKAHTLPASLTIAEAREMARSAFAGHGLAAASLEARFLIEALTGLPSRVTTNFERDHPIDAGQIPRLHEWIDRRLAGEPLDRILGSRAFWSLEFGLNRQTLSPRADTETLVEAALRLLPSLGTTDPVILDLGTGSGAILIAILHECAAARGIGVDLAEEALTMARRNSLRNGVADRAVFICGRWAESLTGPFDLVISNPPYIPTGDIAGLEREVREHDPVLALDGGADGLAAYRLIADGLDRILTGKGKVILEIGAGQQDDVARIMEGAGFQLASIRSDLGGHPRALCFARHPGPSA